MYHTSPLLTKPQKYGKVARLVRQVPVIRYLFYLNINMALAQKNTLAQKTVDALAVIAISASLINSLVNPNLVRAADSSTSTPVVQPVEVDQETTPEPIKEVRKAKRTMTVVATSYSSEAAQTDATPCIPAMWKFDLCENFAKTGIEDTIAANFLPLGTEVRFPELYGDKVFVVRDRMNAKYNGKSRIDFWKSSKPAAVKFGAQRMVMEVL